MPAATPVGGRPQQQQPAPINTSAPAPAAGYMAYGQAPVGSQPQQPPPQQGGGRPQSTYGNAQELATSVYDSPIAPNHPQSAATYSSSVYSQDDPYVTSPAAGAPPPAQSMYTQLPQPSGPSAPPSDAYDGYDAGVQPSGPMGSAPPPSQPTSAPPPVPGSAAARPQPGLAPAPLQPSGPAYDARNTLPSQQRTYNAYVPPGQGQASGPPDVGMGMPPSAPPAGGAEGYYRTQGQTLY